MPIDLYKTFGDSVDPTKCFMNKKAKKFTKDYAEKEQPFPRFRLRIFMSIDIAGSTAFKQSRDENWGPLQKKMSDADPLKGQAWVIAIAAFFREIQLHVNNAWKEGLTSLSKDEKKDPDINDPPRFWKAIGDEVIYTKEVKNPDQALLCVLVVIRAMTTYRSHLKGMVSELDLKATAWLAGFPVNNSEFVIGPERPDMKRLGIEDDFALQHYLRPWLHRYNKPFNGNEKLDYIGPQMDIGFRLTALSTPQQMVLSADLTYIITRALIAKEKNDIKIGFRGMEPLKGVMFGKTYPIFWASTRDNTLEEAQNKLEGKELYKDYKEVNEYCKLFLSSNSDGSPGSFIMIPFFNNESVPDKYRDYLSELQDTFKIIFIRAIDTYYETIPGADEDQGSEAALKEAQDRIDNVYKSSIFLEDMSPPIS